MVQTNSSAASENSFCVAKDHHSLRLLLMGNDTAFLTSLLQWLLHMHNQNQKGWSLKFAFECCYNIVCITFSRVLLCIEQESSHPSKKVHMNSYAAFENSFCVANDHHSLRLLLAGNNTALLYFNGYRVCIVKTKKGH